MGTALKPIDAFAAALRAGIDESVGLRSALKLDFGDEVIIIDGETKPFRVSTEDRDAPCTIKVSKDDFASMVDGRMDTATAFRKGKLTIIGDMGIAVCLGPILDNSQKR